MRGWRKPENGPYGAPRGNPVMKAKRVTGESADTRLKRSIIMERCSVGGCLAHPLVTRAASNGRQRYCAAHVAGKTTQRGSANIKALLDLGNYQTRGR